MTGQNGTISEPHIIPNNQCVHPILRQCLFDYISIRGHGPNQFQVVHP